MNKSHQVGGSHYTRFKIQPVTYIQENKLDFLQGNAIKYITRAPFKGGITDIDKAIHCLYMWREQMEYEDLQMLELERHYEMMSRCAEASGYED